MGSPILKMKLPRKLESWWNGQGGEIARREMVWAWGWVRSREGAGLIVGITACGVGAQVVGPYINWYIEYTFAAISSPNYTPPAIDLFGFYISLQLAIGLAYYVLLFTIALKLLQHRIWPMFESTQLRDLVVADIKPASIWPALLAGPAVVWACVAAAQESGEFLLWIFPLPITADFASWSALMFGEEISPNSIRPGVAFAIGWGRFIAAPLFVLCFTIIKLFSMALAARFSILESRKPVRLLAALFALFLTFGSPVSDFGFGVSNSPDVNSALVSLYWTRPLVLGLVCGLLLLAVLHRLRSPRLWERVREKAEALS